MSISESLGLLAACVIEPAPSDAATAWAVLAAPPTPRISTWRPVKSILERMVISFNPSKSVL